MSSRRCFYVRALFSARTMRPIYTKIHAFSRQGVVKLPAGAGGRHEIAVPADMRPVKRDGVIAG